MRELISLQAIGLSPIEAVRYYLAIRMADRGIVSAPNAAAGVPFQVGGQPTAFYPIAPETGYKPSRLPRSLPVTPTKNPATCLPRCLTQNLPAIRHLNAARNPNKTSCPIRRSTTLVR